MTQQTQTRQRPKTKAFRRSWPIGSRFFFELQSEEKWHAILDIPGREPMVVIAPTPQVAVTQLCTLVKAKMIGGKAGAA